MSLDAGKKRLKEEVQKMSPATVEKRRAVLINVAYIALVLGAFYLFMKYAFWTVAPFLFAFLVAAALQRPTNFISKKTHIKKGIVSVIAVLLIIALLITIVALTGARVVSEVKGLASTLAEWLKKVPDYVKSWETSLYRFTERLPDGLQSSAEDAIKSFSDKLLLSSEERAAQRAQGGEQNSNINLLSILKTPLSGVWSTAKQIPSILVGVLLFIIAACFMTAGYDGIVGFIKNQLTPQKRRTLSKTKQIVFSSMGKLVKSYALIMLITFAEMSIGLSVLKVIGAYKSGYIFIIAIITAIVDILPVLGTGTVVIPWAVFSLINGSYGLGIGLIHICLHNCHTPDNRAEDSREQPRHPADSQHHGHVYRTPALRLHRNIYYADSHNRAQGAQRRRRYPYLAQLEEIR